MELNSSNQNYFLGNYESNSLRCCIKLSFSPKAGVVNTLNTLEFIKFPDKDWLFIWHWAPADHLSQTQVYLQKRVDDSELLSALCWLQGVKWLSEYLFLKESLKATFFL